LGNQPLAQSVTLAACRSMEGSRPVICARGRATGIVSTQQPLREQQVRHSLHKVLRNYPAYRYVFVEPQARLTTMRVHSLPVDGGVMLFRPCKYSFRPFITDPSFQEILFSARYHVR